ncbi:MAG: amidohydrolase family protein [Candidatus Binatia bacterium]
MTATIIDADGHVDEPRSVWQDYAEPAYRDRMIQLVRGQDGLDKLKIEGKVLGDGTLNFAAACIPKALTDAGRSKTLTWDDVPAGGYDPQARLAIMDQEGIEVAFLYPSLWLMFGDIQNPQVAAAACRAYNNWMTDFCRVQPDRLHGAAPVPLQDPVEAATETRRVAKLGMPAVIIRPEPYNNRRLNDPAYEPFWAAAQECNVAVILHGGFGSSMESFSKGRYTNPFFNHMICHPFEQMAACMDIICGGVLEKFPKVRVAFFESGAGWLAYWLQRMDDHYEKMGRFAPWLKKKPREYFRAQCFISLDANDGQLMKSLVELGVEDCIVWGSDYPHFDCTFPGVLQEVKDSVAGLSARAQQKIIGENAVRLYQMT